MILSLKGDDCLTMLLTDGFGLHEEGEDVDQSLFQRTAGPRTFDAVDSGGEKVVHVREGATDAGVSGSVGACRWR